MDVQVRGNGVVIDDELRTFVNRRASQLDRFVDRVVDAKLELRALHSKNKAGPEATAAQITIRSGREVLRAEERAAEPNQAIDKAFDKLERQIRRVHDKRTRRKAAGQPSIRDVAPEPEIEVDGFETDEERAVGELVRTKRFGVKPMDVEEAIEQMELLGHDFFLFHYVDEDIPSVVYRRRDGAYGLLIPKSA
jgi:putative sigma-54 modulation protein